MKEKEGAKQRCYCGGSCFRVCEALHLIFLLTYLVNLTDNARRMEDYGT